MPVLCLRKMWTPLDMIGIKVYVDDENREWYVRIYNGRLKRLRTVALRFLPK